MSEEVFFDRMVPEEVVRRREARPVAYLPVGALEWHGAHLPFGTDYLAVEYIGERAAREIGGVAFPSIYYGDVRYWLHDSRPEWRDEYMREMRIPRTFASNFPLEINAQRTDYETPMPPDEETVEDPLPISVEEQKRFFAKLIAYTLLEIYNYGFRVVVLLPGHEPNIEPCLEGERLYAKNARRRVSLRPPAVTKTFFYLDPLKEIESPLQKHWIHADKTETSVMRVAAPKTVHLDKLPKDPKVIPAAYLGFPYLDPHIGYSEKYRELWNSFDTLDPRHSDPDYGRKLLDYVLERLKEEVNGILRQV